MLIRSIEFAYPIDKLVFRDPKTNEVRMRNLKVEASLTLHLCACMKGHGATSVSLVHGVSSGSNRDGIWRSKNGDGVGSDTVRVLSVGAVSASGDSASGGQYNGGR